MPLHHPAASGTSTERLSGSICRCPHGTCGVGHAGWGTQHRDALRGAGRRCSQHQHPTGTAVPRPRLAEPHGAASQPMNSRAQQGCQGEVEGNLS